jgi:hypothetical protein
LLCLFHGCGPAASRCAAAPSSIPFYVWGHKRALEKWVQNEVGEELGVASIELVAGPPDEAATRDTCTTNTCCEPFGFTEPLQTLLPPPDPNYQIQPKSSFKVEAIPPLHGTAPGSLDIARNAQRVPKNCVSPHTLPTRWPGRQAQGSEAAR